MAGDNVAINAGLALIKLIQAILELYMKVMDNKAGKLQNEVNSLKSELEKTKKDHTLSDKEKADKIDGLEKRIGELEGQIKNLDKTIAKLDGMTDKDLFNALQQAVGPKEKYTINDINEAAKYLANQAVEGRDIGMDKSLLERMAKAKIMAAVGHEPLHVPDNVHQALSQIDQNHPYNAATINQYINVNINNPNVDQNTLQGVQDIQQAYQDGRAVLRNGAQVQTDAQQMTYGKNLGNSMGTMTFGGKSAAGAQQKSAQEQEK